MQGVIIGYRSKTHLNFRYRENSFGHNIHNSGPIILKLHAEPGNITAVLCVR